jgi:hypothetical protein
MGTIAVTLEVSHAPNAGRVKFGEKQWMKKKK